MSKPPTPRGGAARAVIVLCLIAATAGLSLDFALGENSGFWIGARPGGAAAIGAAAAVFGVVAGRIGQMLLGRGDARRSSDADPHA